MVQTTTTAFPMGNKPFVLLVGVMVGFFIGRFPSLKTLPWCVAPFQSQKMIEKKNQDEFSGVAPASTNTSITKDIIAVEPEIHRAQKNGLNVIEEVIPPKILPLYADSNLNFPVTRNMLRQSRPVVGNTERLHNYLLKLQAKKCTKVVFFGGSITMGRKAGGPEGAYPRLFIDWLNAKYPCMEADGSPGVHTYIPPFAGTTSLSHFTNWLKISSIEEFDMVLIEFNVNDSFIPSLVHALEDKGASGQSRDRMGLGGEYAALWYFEVLLRRLLLLRKPDPIAIITFNADYEGRTWSENTFFYDPAKSRQSFFRRNQEPLKNYVSSMYEVPVFSAVIWMLPMAGKRGKYWQFNSTLYPYASSTWHSDSCCHPPHSGHLILSLVLAYCLTEEEKTMSQVNKFDKADAERDFTALDAPILRNPLYLSQQEDEQYVTNQSQYECGDVDFTDSSSGEKTWQSLIMANEGWDWYADNQDNDKYGYIANDKNMTGGQHIAISLSGMQIGRIEISFVVSYENFGDAIAWLDVSSKKDDKGCLPKEPKENMQHKILNAHWNEKASVPKVEVLSDGHHKHGENKILHICLKRPGAKHRGTEHKFKLLGVKFC